MELRGEVSEKQKLVHTLEDSYTNADSEKDFYQRIMAKGFEIYFRRGRETGVVLKRRFRFRTLGYTRSVLRMLDKNLSEVKRKHTIARIRNEQHKQKKGKQR